MSILLLLSGFVIVLALVFRKKPPAPYPPGPPPKPLIGNALDIPPQKQWVKYLEWSKHFKSDIIHMSALGQHIIVLHKMEDISELMEKRSAIYSSRPWIPVAELLGMDNITALIPYGDELKRHRAIYQEGLRKELVPLYYSTITDKVHLMLDQLLSDPRRFKDHCKWLSIATIMSVAFGYDFAAEDKNDRYVTLADRILTMVSELLQPGGTLINVFPILRHVPPWFPGASTQRAVAKAKKLWLAYRTEPYEYVKSRLLAGSSKDCVLSSLLRHRMKDDGVTFEDEDDLKDTMSNVYLAGTETVEAIEKVFIMAMALFPSVQRRVQDEIDRVVGTDRLPYFGDRDSLPLVDAVLRESMRWRPIVPLAFPHATVKDDIYKGYYIPKGSLVMANGWAISQDEALYPNPDTFYPERFFNSDGTLNDDKVDYAFGYGRRICPGKHMAENLLWLMMASVLSTFNISKAKDESGSEIEIDPNGFLSGISCTPQPFQCSITPRSPQATTLIRTAATIAKEDMSTG